MHQRKINELRLKALENNLKLWEKHAADPEDDLHGVAPKVVERIKRSIASQKRVLGKSP